MNTKNLLPVAAISALCLFAACSKEKKETDNPEIETTFRLGQDQAISESIADDANLLFFETAASEGLTGSRMDPSSQTNNLLSCASVTVSPGDAFPKTIAIDFGTGCTSIDGIHRKGKINVVLSDSVLKTGATAVMTFEGYHVQNYKVEGSITWTNTSTQNGFSWTRVIENGKVTTPNGNYYWLHEGTKNVVQAAGSNTPLNLLDDVYSITGDHTVTNPDGKIRTATITEALEKKVICQHVSKGKIKLQGPGHYAIIDYGDGSCDNVATISIDGFPSITFFLP